MPELYIHNNNGGAMIGPLLDMPPPRDETLPPNLRCIGAVQDEDIRYTEEDLRALERSGFYTIGAGVLMYGLIKNQPHLLLAKHKPSEKHPESVWSLPTETTQFARTSGGEIVVESGLQTVLRNSQEELELPEPPILVQPETPWVTISWPLGASKDEARIAFVGLFALGVPFGLENIVESFKPHPDNEIESLALFPLNQPDQFKNLALRNGFLDMLAQIMLRNVELTSRNRTPFFDNSNLFPGENISKMNILWLNDLLAKERDQTLIWQDVELAKLDG